MMKQANGVYICERCAGKLGIPASAVVDLMEVPRSLFCKHESGYRTYYCPLCNKALIEVESLPKSKKLKKEV